MAEARNIGPGNHSIGSNVPALTRHWLNWTKANYLRAETITSALMPDWLIFSGIRCHWHTGMWVEEKWHLQMECALLRQSEHQLPDRTANTLIIAEDHLVQPLLSDQYSGFHGIVIPGPLRDSIFVLAEGLRNRDRAGIQTEIMYR